MDTTERKPGFFMGEDAQEIQLRPEDEVIERLLNQLVDMFVAQLLPHEVRFEIKMAGPKGKLAKTATKFLQTGNYEKAIELFRESLESKPDDHGALYDLGIAYEATGQLKLALQNYERAYSLKDNNYYYEAIQRARPMLQGMKEEAQAVPAANKRPAENPTEGQGESD
jgi:tetratricopeptide (TPR) repeat protein